ncbi:FAD dependent oxidoreductase [Nitratireductor basaltis]|uniref:FAD dependent oxidoreductase n=1 Tax=Nitratireductor basaltis TaxID=472175 RepID=A0A084UBZ0_9HYPH|nr:FAD dependent oxidoreductase [Nitratireductor basaltis]
MLRNLGILDHLQKIAVQPQAVLLRSARDGSVKSRLPLGEQAQDRWGASYLTCHRADLQSALLECVTANRGIKLKLDALAQGFCFTGDRVSHPLSDAQFDLLLAADGIWSGLRKEVTSLDARFVGRIAYRAMLSADHPAARAIFGTTPNVHAFMAAGFHTVAYPVSGGTAYNLVVVLPGNETQRGWVQGADLDELRHAFKSTILAPLIAADGWSQWPLYEVPPLESWSRPPNLLLTGDAAHGLTPFAAQGAAMAIEDASVLAGVLDDAGSVAEALAKFERQRKPRIEQVRRRAGFNSFAWHAAGPVALIRDLVLKHRTGAKLMADFDWLYGWRED